MSSLYKVKNKKTKKKKRRERGNVIVDIWDENELEKKKKTNEKQFPVFPSWLCE
jgi:hypothetical protein